MTTQGYIYLIEAPNGLYKLGRAQCPERRLKELQYHSPVRLTLVYSLRCQDAVKAEYILHKVFKEKRSHGEWFALDPEDITFLVSRLGRRGLIEGAGLEIELQNKEGLL